MSESFEPLPKCPIDVDHQLEQTVRQFSSLKNGLPELVKNSKDAYARCGVVNKEDRPIFILLGDGRDRKSARLGVLDFAGASISDFEGESESEYAGWITWSSRTANKASVSTEIEGGYGNGGKSFMVAGSLVSSSMHSSKDGKRTKMGFDSQSRFTPGYFLENGQKVRDIHDPDPRGSLQNALTPYSLSFSTLGQVTGAFAKRKNWTLVELVGVKEIDGKWEDQFVELVLNTLSSHGQCSFTISTSNVFVIKNGEVIAGPIAEEPLEPYADFKKPFMVDIPQELKDPLTNEVVRFAPGDRLTILTSKKALNLQIQWRPRNILRVRWGANVVGYYPMAQLAPSSVYSHLYGEVICNTLTKEDFSGQLRSTLNETVRTRALEAWLRDQLNEIGEKISDAVSERTSLKERLEVGENLEQFRRIMAEFLDTEDIPNAVDEGQKSGGNGHEKKVRKSGDPVKVLLEGGVSFLSVPVGVQIPVRHEALDAKDREVPRRHFRFESDPEGIVESDGGGNITGLQKGRTSIWAIDIDSGLRSNVVEVTVHNLVEVSFSPEKTAVMQGERLSLNVAALNDDGQRPDRLALSYQVLPEGGGRVGRLGFFTAGSQPGKTDIRATFGPQGKSASLIMEVTNEKKERPPPGWKGGGVPYIVLCGDVAPGCTDLPENERTLPSDPDAPTIIMYEPFWNERGVIWINQGSAESRRIRERTAGNAPLSRVNTATYMEFLAMKCFEILKMLKVQQLIEKDTKVSVSDMVLQLARAEIETAPFIDAAFKVLEKSNLGGLVAHV